MLKHDPYVLIVDGIDASGKNTLCKNIYKFISNFQNDTDYINNMKVNPYYNLYRKSYTTQKFQKMDIFKYSFPDYESTSGKAIKKQLTENNMNVNSRVMLATMFAINRHLHHIKNNLYNFSRNSFIICDRYYPANFAYNYEVGIDYLLEIESQSFVGDKVIILDVDPKLSFERRKERRDVFENDLKYLETVRENYLKLAKRYSWYVYDGMIKSDELAQMVIENVLGGNSDIIDYKE